MLNVSYCNYSFNTAYQCNKNIKFLYIYIIKLDAGGIYVYNCKYFNNKFLFIIFKVNNGTIISCNFYLNKLTSNKSLN